MENKKRSVSQRTRFLALSLKKNKIKNDQNMEKLNRSSDVILLDESFDKLRSDFLKPKIYSPIVINDSCELSHEEILNNKEDKHPSKSGNVSFNLSVCDSPTQQNKSQPSSKGWSPAQDIFCATPRIRHGPSTPADVLNESQENCSMEKIQKSHHKLLSEIYGDIWKILPNFKTPSGVSKRLLYDDDECDKENIRSVIKKNKELYLTESERKKIKHDAENAERKSKKKLYTEKIASTPDVPKPKLNVPRDVKTTVKKKVNKAITVTELVQIMDSVITKDEDNVDRDISTKRLQNEDITTKKVHNADSLAEKLQNSDISTKNIQNGDILTKKLQNKDIPTKRLQNRDISTKHIQNGDIFSKKLQDEDILTKKIQNGDILTKNVDILSKRLKNVDLCHTPETKRLSFIASLADNVPPWRCHPEALQYHDSFSSLRERLARRLFAEFNRAVFGGRLPDVPVTWDTKLRSTAGTTTNRLIKKSSGEQLRVSSIKLSCKVVDGPQRARDTLVHEMCHAATWLLDGELRAGHGPLWGEWCKAALRAFPELGRIARCHELEIHYKYCYRCTRCGYSIKRHSKSIDITKKLCGYCRGTFEIMLNKKNKDGVVVSTPARAGSANGFARYVKEHYGAVKAGRSHAQVMRLLGEQFSAQKKKNNDL